MSACILELSDPPYLKYLQIETGRIHFESLVVGIQTLYRLRSHSSLAIMHAPLQSCPLPGSSGNFREKISLLGRQGTSLQWANLVSAPKTAVHRQADYPVVNNPRRSDWQWPENKTLQRIVILHTFPCLLLEFMAEILPELVLTKMEHLARTAKPVTMIPSKNPRKVCNSISSERNLLQY